METRDKTLGLVVDFGTHHYNGTKKEKIYETLKFGKLIAEKHWNYKENVLSNDQLAFYLDNMVVRVDKDKCPYGKKHEWVYEIKSVYENYKKVEENVTLNKEPVFQNQVHVSQNKLGRQIPLNEIMQTLKYGLFVSDHKKKNKFWHYNRYYFLNDCCVMAKETKDQYIISTVYRTSAIADGGFLEDIEKYMHGLKVLPDNHVEIGVRNETAFMKYKASEECKHFCMLAWLQKGESLWPAAGPGPLASNFRDRLYYNNLRVAYLKDPNSITEAITIAAIYKMTEYGCIPYSTNPGAVPFEDFIPVPHHEYSLLIDIESKEDKLTSRQKRYLKIMGLDPERFEHNRSFKDNIIKLEFNLNQFSANDQPWAHRRNNGT